MKIVQTNILLLLLSINMICIDSASSNNDAVEFYLGDTVIFDSFDNNYFKLNYGSYNKITVFLFTRLPIGSIVLTDPDDIVTTIEGQSIYYSEKIIEFNLDKKGIYYLKFNQRYEFALEDESYFFGNAFTIFVVGETFNIDLTQKMYFNPFKIESRTNHNSTIYKVENLKKNIYVFFSYDENYYSYDSAISRNPFEICDETNVCTKDKTIYQFLAGKKYTIKVNFINAGNNYDQVIILYKSLKYIIFIQKIQKNYMDFLIIIKKY